MQYLPSIDHPVRIFFLNVHVKTPRGSKIVEKRMSGNNLAGSGNNLAGSGNNLAGSGNNLAGSGNNLAGSGLSPVVVSRAGLTVYIMIFCRKENITYL